MSAERPVLRPAGNVALLKKSPKPPPSPVKPTPPPLLPLPSKASPPNSQPCTPRNVTNSLARSPVISPSKVLSPRKPAPLSLGPPSLKKLCPQADIGPPSPGAIGIACDPAENCLPKLPAARKTAPRVASLTRSSSEVFHRGGNGGNLKANRPIAVTANKLGSLSLDETALSHIVAAKKAAASVVNAQRKLKAAEYGRKQGKASRVAPEVASLLPVSVEPKRCKFITAQSDPLHVEHHDKEWGVPCHDDRMLFELLILAGAQAELSWTTILHRRDTYRATFFGFDPEAVASFSEKHIQAVEADQALQLPGGKIRGVVENAKRIQEVIREHGSLDNYFWSFLSFKPMANNYRLPKQVPVKTSKSESISKDLVRRGFRFVGPTIIYSFMQAAGMTNDHLVQCFRHQECANLGASSQAQAAQEKPQEPQCFSLYEECEFFPLQLDGDQTLEAESFEYFDEAKLETQQTEQLEERDEDCLTLGEGEHGSMDMVKAIDCNGSIGT